MHIDVFIYFLLLCYSPFLEQTTDRSKMIKLFEFRWSQSEALKK